MDELEKLRKQKAELLAKQEVQKKELEKKQEIKKLKKEISDLKYGKVKNIFSNIGKGFDNIGKNMERVSIGDGKSGRVPHDDLIAPVPKKYCSKCGRPADMLIGGLCINCC